MTTWPRCARPFPPEIARRNGEHRPGKGQGLGLYLTREPVILAILTLITIVLFLAVSGLSHIYHAQQESLANRWFNRGATDLKAQHYKSAVAEFRTALLYSRDNYSFQLNLAEALLGEKRTDEAYAYLINLWIGNQRMGW